MTVFRCRICTRPVLAADPPSRCPACGAGQQWLAAAVAYHPSATPELAESLRDDLRRWQKALVANGRFFGAAAKVADEEEGRALFQALAVVAGEQAGVLAALCGEEAPALAAEQGDCSPVHRENLNEARQRVKEALEGGRQVLGVAPEGRAREVADALVGTGRDHLELLAR